MGRLLPAVPKPGAPGAQQLLEIGPVWLVRSFPLTTVKRMLLACGGRRCSRRPVHGHCPGLGCVPATQGPKRGADRDARTPASLPHSLGHLPSSGSCWDDRLSEIH